MDITAEKLQKLMDIAKLYYEQDKTQNEIAKLYGISRPLVSRMLREAKELSIVNIEIRTPVEWNNLTLNRLCKTFTLRGGAVVKNSANDILTNDAVSKAAISYMMNLKQNYYGIGWGHIIGHMVCFMEHTSLAAGFAGHICPLIGNSGVGNRNYHSNELVRVFAECTGATPAYLYAPALVSSQQELNLQKELENYREIKKAWDNLDVALVNIGNYPSVPDFASAARYGDLLIKQKPAGRMLGYFFDINGKIFHSDTDYMLQIPIETLLKAKHIIGICSSNTNPQALIGGLKTGFINHLIAPEDTVKAALNAYHAPN